LPYDPLRSKNNRIPASVKTVHLIAACGTAMGALACMLKESGRSVTGSDEKVYPPMSTYLAERGIPIREGFSADHLDHRPDLVVVGNAVSANNLEVVELAKLGLPFCSMPQAFNRFAADGKKAVVVTGTHGKTTTSAVAAWLLEWAGMDPSFVIGGILKNFGGNYRLGDGTTIVFEGDEYDTAFFDKGPKFLHYAPSVAVLTGVEFDHADIYRDLDHVTSAFHRFVSSMPRQATLVAFGDDPVVNELIRDCPCRVETYGTGDRTFWRLEDLKVDPPWTRFTAFRDGRSHGRFSTPMMGAHNALNALSAVAVADRMGIPASAVDDALKRFAGVRRRQEVRGEASGVTVIDDFAHHPTAVRETLRAIRPYYPGRRLIAVFEPRTHASMRKVFQHVYPKVFDPADLVCIREPSMLHKVPAAERFSAERLAADLQRRGKDARYFPGTEEIIAFLVQSLRSGDVVLIMSNGGFDNIHERLLERLRGKPPDPNPHLSDGFRHP